MKQCHLSDAWKTQSPTPSTRLSSTKPLPRDDSATNIICGIWISFIPEHCAASVCRVGKLIHWRWRRACLWSCFGATLTLMNIVSVFSIIRRKSVSFGCSTIKKNKNGPSSLPCFTLVACLSRQMIGGIVKHMPLPDSVRWRSWRPVTDDGDSGSPKFRAKGLQVLEECRSHRL